ncbi:Uncharacterised protein [Staphylococcus aureus]|nr:Uncharacterised protein [Staphylococcus aureus]
MSVNPAYIEIKFVIPGLLSRSNLIIPSESVTALLIFLAATFGSSNNEMKFLALSSLLLIFLVGSCKLMTRPPTLGIRISGFTSTSL